MQMQMQKTLRSAGVRRLGVTPVRVGAPARRSLQVVSFRGDGKQLQKDYESVTQGKGYDKNAFEVNPATPAFTRRREVFVGRLAMSGFLAAVVGEILTGKGILGQLYLETNLPPMAVNALVFGLVAYSFLGVLNPATWSRANQEDVAKRPKGGVQDPKINAASDPGRFLGLEGFQPGFTKKNELFVGRLAMLGFAAAIVGEKLTGKGPLGQIGIPFHLPLDPFYSTVALGVWVFFWGVSAVGYNNFGQTEGDEEIY